MSMCIAVERLNNFRDLHHFHQIGDDPERGKDDILYDSSERTFLLSTPVHTVTNLSRASVCMGKEIAYSGRKELNERSGALECRVEYRGSSNELGV
jgi:hypothetical protein